MPGRQHLSSSGQGARDLETDGLHSGDNGQRLDGRVGDSHANALGDVLVDSSEDGDYREHVRRAVIGPFLDSLTLPSLDNGALDAAKGRHHIRDKMWFLGIVENVLPECAGLLKLDCRV